MITEKDALQIATVLGLEKEVAREMSNGLSPEEALDEWDCPHSLEEIEDAK